MQMIVTFIIASFIAYVIYALFLKKKSTNHLKNAPPVVPSSVPWLGVGREFSSDSFQFFTENKEKYGPIYSFYMAGIWWTYLGDREAYDTFFKARDSELRLMSKSFEEALGPQIWGMLWNVSDAPEHVRQEMKWGSKWQGHFSRCLSTLHSKAFVPLIQRKTQQALNELPQSGTVDIFKFLQKLVVQLSGRLVLGDAIQDFPDFAQVWEDFEYVIHSQANMVNSYVLALPLPASRRRKAAMGRLIEIIAQILDKAKEQENRDRYDNMMNAVLETAKIEDRWIGSEAMAPLVITLILAATFNVAASVFWTVFFLLKFPKNRDAVNKEISALLPQYLNEGRELPELSMDTVQQMHGLHRTVKEALRLNSSTMLVRQMVKPLTVEFTDSHGAHHGPYELPMGRVCLSPQVCNMDPEVYPEPNAFCPDRFVDFEEKKYNFASFGGGIHKCKGEHLAYVQAQTMAVTIMHTLDMELLQDKMPEPNTKLFGVLKPADPVMVKYNKRVQQQE